MNIKRILTNFALVMGIITLTQCASTQKMNTIMPSEIKNPYFKNWNTDDTRGFTIYIPIEENSTMVLENAYFRQKKIKLEKDPTQSMYLGKYTFPKTKNDMVMSGNPKKEYGNTLPGDIQRIPYKIKDNQCVVEYTKDANKVHFKIENLAKKE